MAILLLLGEIRIFLEKWASSFSIFASKESKKKKKKKKKKKEMGRSWENVIDGRNS